MALTFDPKVFADIEEAREKWQKELEDVFSAQPERLERFATVSDKEIQRIYTPMDIKDQDWAQKIGFPGEPPFTRGVQPSMYRGRLWTMRMFAGLGSAKDTNKRFHVLVKAGQTGLSTASLPGNKNHHRGHGPAQ